MGICMLAIPFCDRARLRGLLAEMRKEHAYLIYGTVVHRRGTRDSAIWHHRLHTGGRGVWVVAHSTVVYVTEHGLADYHRKAEKKRPVQCGFEKCRCGTAEII